MKKMMITGTHGFVGARAIAQYQQKYEIATIPGEMLRRAEAEELRRYVAEFQPDILIHTAAISDTGACERDEKASYRANVLLTEGIALAAADCGTKLVVFSSDQVYNGCENAGPYKETEHLKPANVYGRHKLEAEQRTLDLLPQAVLLRLTWMYDMPGYGMQNRGNLFMNILTAAMRKESISFPAAQYRGITYVRQVIEFLEQAVELPGGAYNFGSENTIPMYETALTLADALGIEKDAQDFIRRDEEMKRHNLWMDCGKIKSQGICFDTTTEGFYRCSREYGLCL